MLHKLPKMWKSDRLRPKDLVAYSCSRTATFAAGPAVATWPLAPKRMVVGEVREEEPAKGLLKAWNTGHSGGLG
jgi:hypothetical protein